jgi:hypothetical protein
VPWLIGRLVLCVSAFSFASAAALCLSFVFALTVSKAIHTCADALEHAAWTKGSRHMQPLRDDFNWFQQSSIDVILFVAAVLAAVIAAVTMTMICLGRRLIRWLARTTQTDQTHEHQG